MKRDAALEIVRGIWRDLTDRSGYSMDSVDRTTKLDILCSWYQIAARGIDPSSSPHASPPIDALKEIIGG